MNSKAKRLNVQWSTRYNPSAAWKAACVKVANHATANGEKPIVTNDDLQDSASRIMSQRSVDGIVRSGEDPLTHVYSVMSALGYTAYGDEWRLSSNRAGGPSARSNAHREARDNMAGRSKSQIRKAPDYAETREWIVTVDGRGHRVFFDRDSDGWFARDVLEKHPMAGTTYGLVSWNKEGLVDGMRELLARVGQNRSGGSRSVRRAEPISYRASNESVKRAIEHAYRDMGMDRSRMGSEATGEPHYWTAGHMVGVMENSGHSLSVKDAKEAAKIINKELKDDGIVERYEEEQSEWDGHANRSIGRRNGAGGARKPAPSASDIRTLAVTGTAYRSRASGSYLLHSADVSKSVPKSLCGRVKGSNLLDDPYAIPPYNDGYADVTTPPTCPICLKKDPRFANMTGGSRGVNATKALEAMRIYLGSVDYASVRSQDKLHRAAMKQIMSLASKSGMDVENVWAQVESKARSVGVIRPVTGRDH